ncbi:MaoC family dehydratase N-terminal domain-containing protein [Streptomyces sp. NEAU-YJ-81]|uniref:MaoC family dehydratase n=1 Tax=Streptomyces sp. NEAU-YJ-81 TaxID=2820288 RepID=UPI001ABC78E4|nr:MaoC family dehydratase N-terminal domain-containing protein [Streptomyces sp. NEAU-YJ-81]MBO3682252.1 MaoC family dehydratase N-terminal domain-containing protein [Streptomyces sp. NEAU-YJ-81]
MTGTRDAFFEDFTEGLVIETLRRTITEPDLVGFVQIAGLFEEIWLDAGKSARIGLGGRAVPGGLTFVISEGLLVLTGSMGNAVGMLGVDNLRWSHPVCVGDTVHGRSKVTEARRSSSKPDRGVVSITHELLNQDNEVVLSYSSTRLIAARGTEKCA